MFKCSQHHTMYIVYCVVCTKSQDRTWPLVCTQSPSCVRIIRSYRFQSRGCAQTTPSFLCLYIFCIYCSFSQLSSFVFGSQVPRERLDLQLLTLVIFSSTEFVLLFIVFSLTTTCFAKQQKLKPENCQCNEVQPILYRLRFVTWILLIVCIFPLLTIFDIGSSKKA